MRHALKASEASVAPLCAVALHHLSVLVELIGVSGKRCRERERIFLRELEAQACGEVAPRAFLCGEVVGERAGELVDEAYLLFARRVAVALHLHFQVVRHRHRHQSLLRARRVAVKAAAVRRVLHGRHGAVLVDAVVGLRVAVARGGEVGRVTEAHAGLEHVADGYDLAVEEAQHGFVHTVERGVGRYAEVPVVEVVEAVSRVAQFLLLLRVPRAVDALCVHDVAERDGGRNVDILEQLERCIDRHAVGHAVAPVLDKVRLEELAFLRRDAVGELSGVAHGYFLIPSLLAHLPFAAEGIEAREGDAEVGQGDGNRRVAHVLRQVARGGDGEADVGKVFREAHGAGAGALRVGEGIVHALQVLSLIVF